MSVVSSVGAASISGRCAIACCGPRLKGLARPKLKKSRRRIVGNGRMAETFLDRHSVYTLAILDGLGRSFWQSVDGLMKS